MQRLSVIFFLFIISGNCFAQPANLARHRQFVNFLSQISEGKPSLKTTSLHERVIAQSIYDNTATTPKLLDSVLLAYKTRSHTSAYDFNLLFYPYNYPYSNTPLYNFLGNFAKPLVLYDTFMHWGLDPNTLIYGFYETTIADYDTALNLNKFTDLFTDSVTNQNMSYINTFNTSGNITAGYWFRHIASKTDSAYKQFFSYNAAHKLTNDSIYLYDSGSWKLVAKSSYTYDIYGNLIQADSYTDSGSKVQEQLRYVNTYDAANHLISVLTSQYDGTSLIPYVKDTFAYTAAYTYHTAWREYQYDGINHKWVGISNMTKHVNGKGVPDTVLIKAWDTSKTWVSQTKDVITYDSSGNPLTLLDYEVKDTFYNFRLSTTTTYYYQPYIPLAVVNNAANNTIKVYPNPATDILYITGLGNAPAYILLLSATGQQVKGIFTSSVNNITMNVGDLPAGLYVLVVRNTDGDLVCKSSIVKR